MLDEVQRRWGGDWRAIVAARARTADARARLESLREFETDTTSIVVFGSLGRREVTSGSDADWTLLFDGPSDLAHFKQASQIGRRFADLGFKGPGATGTFGQLSSSHELVHYIAGTRDTNENLTRRMLLLAESHAITSPSIREAVLRKVLSRYVIHDRPAPNRTRSRHVIPHFLMNDVVRYWRTITSDYAAKLWERDAQGWAIRNVKLRFSRKLIFVWGLLTCFAYEVFPHDEIALAELIFEQTRITPLDQLCRLALLQNNETAAREVLDSYDLFLSALQDERARKHLDALPFDAAADDELFGSLRDASRRFQDGISRLFWEDEKLSNLLRRYGVF